MEAIKSKIRTIPNFPKEGIMFRDITTLLQDAQGQVVPFRFRPQPECRDQIEILVVGIGPKGQPQPGHDLLDARPVHVGMAGGRDALRQPLEGVVREGFVMHVADAAMEVEVRAFVQCAGDRFAAAAEDRRRHLAGRGTRGRQGGQDAGQAERRRPQQERRQYGGG